jgi:hypothetical protein
VRARTTGTPRPHTRMPAHALTPGRWKTLLLQSYVGAHPGLRFCPHPGCAQTIACAGAAGSALTTAVPTAVCGAGHTLCAGCGMDASHRPLVCALAREWLKSAREDAGTAQWIRANTRECPKCKGVIEKGGGCKCVPRPVSAPRLTPATAGWCAGTAASSSAGCA